jgi:hypothetical protein
MSKTETKKLPIYSVFSVIDVPGKKSIWHDLGVVWGHEDNKGGNVAFKARPLEGARIVLRAFKPRTEKPKKKAA